jgi:hypothetical protein
MSATRASTLAQAWSGDDCSISSMIRLPTTTASAIPATAAAVAASRMPKPTPTGTPVRARISGMRAATAATSSAAEPVTPFSET